VGTLNVEGWRTAADEVEAILREKEIMILGVQETWLKPDSLDVPNISGYSWFGAYVNSNSNRGEGGVGFLVHNSIANDVKFVTPSRDSRVILLELRGCVVVNVYNFTSQRLEEQCEALEVISNILYPLF